jgi:predicted short-subunit dehydrogenase-like oxidoreductase (DUF2520 family)
LKKAGYSVDELVTRDSTRSLRKVLPLAKKVGASSATLASAHFAADIILISVPDDSIRVVAQQLAKRKDIDWKSKVVIHTSGALSSDELKPLRKRDASVASAHPMNSFVSGTKPDFTNIPFAIEGDKAAVAAVTKIVKALGGDPFTISGKNKVLYHALGAFASPLLISHLQLAEQVGKRAGVKDTKEIIAQILKRTLNNYLSGDTASAFSGPLLRGDVETIKKHLAALKQVPAARAAYMNLARNAAENLPVKNRPKLKKLLH